MFFGGRCGLERGAGQVGVEAGTLVALREIDVGFEVAHANAAVVLALEDNRAASCVKRALALAAPDRQRVREIGGSVVGPMPGVYDGEATKMQPREPERSH